jgi:hypothetical protein
VRRIALAAVSAAALFPAAAQASPVLVFDGSRASRHEDPTIPPEDFSASSRRQLRGAAHASAQTRSTRGPSVGEALAHLLRTHQIDRDAYEARRDEYRAAVGTARRLSGRRRTELRAVIRRLDAMAGEGALVASRLRPLFLTLVMNRRWWASAPVPADRSRVAFTGSRLVWEYYSGEGIQLQMLASFGKANGLWQGHFDAGLRALLEELAPLAAQRAGGVAWESYFGWEGSPPPWVSAITQGTAVQALARASRRLHHPAYLALAHEALAPFRARAPNGVRASGPSGPHYLIYSFAPRQRVLNSFAQSLVGLYDYAAISGDRVGAELFRTGELEARREVPSYDTGAWSLYQPHVESSLSYHELVQGFLERLCERTATRVYCATATRFARYVHERPRLADLARRARARRRARLSFHVSKISYVALTVRSGSRVLLRRAAELGRGGHYFSWTPPRAGRYTLELSARDLAGNRGTAAGRVEVTG